MIRSICTALAVTAALTLVACASDTTDPEPETTTTPASASASTDKEMPKVDTTDIEPKIVGCLGPKPTYCSPVTCICSPVNHTCHWGCTGN